MYSREQAHQAGRPHRDASPARRSDGGARRPEAGAVPPRGAEALQRSVGNAAAARMIGEQREGAGTDERRAVLGIQRVTGDQAATPRRPRVQMDPNNVLRICGAATYDGETVTPGTRSSELQKIVWENHWAAVSEVCRKHKYTIAVRETGEHSIRRIAEGARPKPHTILEKSIKPSSVRKKYGTGPGQAQGDPKLVLRWLEQHDLSGFVGHWGADGLIGLRIDNPPDGIRDLGIVETGDGHEEYVPLKVGADGDKNPELALLKSFAGWKKYLYTGDYDLHEVYSAQGGTGGGQIPEATPEKAKLLNRLNSGIARNSPEEVVRSGTVATSEHGTLHMSADSGHAMFQHGDQATYRMNQYLEAQAAALENQVARQAAQLVRAVAMEADEPLAWCRMGQWYVTRNREEHAILRARWNLAVPHTWGAAEVDRTARGGYRTAGYLD
ncbi:hypothetical protein [Kitasatospora sp. NPDC005856]|uniref:hypothetical protein n=1 Tax=Kitasatospora sp. NPDC005856 TaxID=3154566 RepID=UPI00340E915F